jgi:hypothetical protein
LKDQEGLDFDRYGRMRYHPDYHFSHGKKMSEAELEYLCKFYEFDHARHLAFALGRTEHTLRIKVDALKRKGLYGYYKNLNKHW